MLSKPVIGCLTGYAVAGGLELALWCDLRVAESNVTLGFMNRRFGRYSYNNTTDYIIISLGVPLIDGGTVRLPLLIGLSRALDLVLTGRTIDASEALAIGSCMMICHVVRITCRFN
jgi:enoyl-CoA hydratase